MISVQNVTAAAATAWLALAAFLQPHAAAQFMDEGGDAPVLQPSDEREVDPEFPDIDAGRALFRDAVEALASLGSASGRVVLDRDGSLKKHMPVGSGQFRAARLEAEGDGPGRFVYRVDGEYTPQDDKPAERVVYYHGPDMEVWIDEEDRVVHEAHAGADASSPIGGAMLSVDELFGPEPLKRELAAVGYKIEEPQDIDGVRCEVVYVKYTDELPRRSRGGRSSLELPQGRWFIGAEDRLPRRIERINSAEFFSITVIQEIQGLRVDPSIDPASLAIETPDGYDRRVTRAPGAPGAPAAQPVVTPEPAKPLYPIAPDFDLRTVDGETVNLDTLSGKAAVLYFWGTWCVPCRQYSPLVSELVDTFAAADLPVEVYAPAVRERSPERPREYLEKNEYKHTLLLGPGDPIGADHAARAYRVRVYPTLVAIGPEGELLATVRAGGASPEEVVGEIEQAIRDYFAEQAEG